jgi:hypothetical protein
MVVPGFKQKGSKSSLIKTFRQKEQHWQDNCPLFFSYLSTARRGMNMVNMYQNKT